MKIEPLFYQGLNCIDVLIVSYAKYLHKEVELVFSKSWSFYIDQKKIVNSKKFAENFGAENFRLTREQIDLLGLKINFFPIVNFDIFVNYLKEIFDKNIPVGIYIDSYYCPWHSRYGLDHGDHYILGYNITEDNEIICIDPGFNDKSYEKLKISLLKKGYKNYFILKDCGLSKQCDYSLIFTKSIKELEESNISNNIKIFGDYFNDYFDYFYECKDILYNPWSCGVFRNFMTIVGGRRQFVQFLNYIKTYVLINNYDDIVKLFNQVCSKWDTIRWLLVKCDEMTFKKKYKKKIYEILLNLSEEEAILIKMLKNHHQITQKIHNNRSEIPLINLSHQKIDLSKFLNNKSFSYINKEFADFSGLSEWYYSNENTIEEIKKLSNSFHININDTKNNNDNVACFEQRVEIPEQIYREVILIASSDFDSITTKVKLVSGANDIIELDFLCSKWTEPQGFPNEVIVLECKRGHKNIDGSVELYNDVGYIYEYILQIPTDSTIKSIILPLCPNIHIYAINMNI